MFKIRLSCSGIDPAARETAATDIQNEFRCHRPWYQEVSCHIEEGDLILTATNDFDEAGPGLLDEFSDCLCAYLAEHGDIRVISVEPA